MAPKSIDGRAMRALAAFAVLAMVSVSVTACGTDAEAAKRKYLASGDEYSAKGQWREAILQYRNAIQQDPRFGQAHFRLSESYDKGGDLRNAYAEAMRAADLLPDRVDAQLRAATFLLAARRFEDAKVRADKALMIEPQNAKALVARGHALAGLDDFPAALKEVQQAVDLTPDDSSVYASLAQLQLATGKRDEAEATFKRALTAAPDSADVRLALANFFWATGRRSDAEREFVEVLRLDSRNTLAHQALAILYLAAQRPAEAEFHLKWAAEQTQDPAARFRLADYYVTMKRAGEAAAILEQMSSQDGTFGAAQTRLAAIAYAKGDSAGAHRTLDAVIKRLPNDVGALGLRAQLLTREGELDAALASATAAVRAEPQNPLAHFIAAQVYARRTDLEQAVKEYWEVMKLNPQAVAAQVQIAAIELARRRPADALQAAESAQRMQPENPDVSLLLARSLIATGDVTRSAGILRDLSAKYPRSAEVETERGKLLLSQRNPAGARRAFEHVLDLDPQSAPALNGLVMLDLADGNAAQARARVETGVARAPNNVPLLLLAARTYARTGTPQKSEAMLRKAIELDAANIDAYGLLAQVYAQLGDTERALAEFSQVTARQPRAVGAHTAIGLLLETQHRTAEARKKYEEVLDIDPRAAVAANNLAWIYAETGGDLEAALRLAQTAREQLPERADVNDTLGYVFLKKRLFPQAIDAFRVAVQQDANNPVLRYHLGLAFARSHMSADARRELQQALTLKPAFAGADDARRELQALD